MLSKFARSMNNKHIYSDHLFSNMLKANKNFDPHTFLFIVIYYLNKLYGTVDRRLSYLKLLINF